MKVFPFLKRDHHEDSPGLSNIHEAVADGPVRRYALSRAEGEESSRISSQVLEDYAPTQKGQGPEKSTS